MKKITIYLLTILLSTTMACSKDDAASTSTTSPSASGLAAGKCKISFDYSGAASGSFSSLDLSSTALKNSTYGNISGSALSGSSADILMFIQPLSETGTISFKTLANSTINTVSFSKGASGWAASSGDDFTIVITKNDGVTVEATFSGKLTNDTDKSVINISNGKLAAKY